MNNSEQWIEDINKTLNSMKYDLDYDTDVLYPRDCNCHAIHRCATISVSLIGLRNFWNVLESAGKNLNDINRYCLGRALVNCGIFNTENYHANIVNGYYGEELDNISFENTHSVVSAMKEIVALSSIDEKVKYVLNMEYGYILDCLKSKKFGIYSISTDVIRIGAEGHYKKSDTKIRNMYSEPGDTEILGIVFEENPENFRLVDGYHRFAQAMSEQKEHANFIVGH